jgi:hypothetical protein
VNAAVRLLLRQEASKLCARFGEAEFSAEQSGSHMHGEGRKKCDGTMKVFNSSVENVWKRTCDDSQSRDKKAFLHFALFVCSSLLGINNFREFSCTDD